MSDEYIQTIFHHLTEGDVYGIPIDKDHFSITELHAYTKERGYVVVGGFHYQNPRTKQLQMVESDQQLLDLVKYLKNGDTFELFIKDQPFLDENVVPTTLLTGPEVNLAEVEQVDVVVGEISNLEGQLSDIESSDSDLGDIPEEDDSEVDEELRILREERRCKKQRKKAVQTQEIPVGEAGGIDRGFEDIGKNKKYKYAGKLGGDEDYLSSSDCWSDDSREELDAEAVRGVDLPSRWRIKKVRYDEDCEVSIFELGMIFENAIQFRKAVADYAVEYRRQLKLRPNEKDRVRVMCKAGHCKWTLFAATDRDSGDFLVKKYHPVHRCIPLNKNKLCGSILIARKFKDQIVSRPDIRIWEIQDLVRKKLGLYVGRTVLSSS